MPVEYQCPMRGCGNTVREPYHSVSMCYRCRMLVVPYRVDVKKMDRTVSKKQQSKTQPERKRMSISIRAGKKATKMAAILAILAILITPLASCADQGAQQQADTQAQQAPTLEQLNAQFIYWTGAKEVMTQQARAANEAVGAYTVQIDKIKSQIDAMHQANRPADGDKKEPAKKK